VINLVIRVRKEQIKIVQVVYKQDHILTIIHNYIPVQIHVHMDIIYLTLRVYNVINLVIRVRKEQIKIVQVVYKQDHILTIIHNYIPVQIHVN